MRTNETYARAPNHPRKWKKAEIKSKKSAPCTHRIAHTLGAVAATTAVNLNVTAKVAVANAVERHFEHK